MVNFEKSFWQPVWKRILSLFFADYAMNLVSAGEDFYATMRRSTNGGGENSPKLEGEDDFYELLMASLEAAEKAE
jgi:hypothetical protein